MESCLPSSTLTQGNGADNVPTIRGTVNQVKVFKCAYYNVIECVGL